MGRAIQAGPGRPSTGRMVLLVGRFLLMYCAGCAQNAHHPESRSTWALLALATPLACVICAPNTMMWLVCPPPLLEFWAQQPLYGRLRQSSLPHCLAGAASELGEGGQLPLKSDEGQNPAPGAPQAVAMGSLLVHAASSQGPASALRFGYYK